MRRIDDVKPVGARRSRRFNDVTAVSPDGQMSALAQGASKRPEGRAPETLVASLLSWFLIHARDLPWRRTLDPYAIWISEIMLQQTQVKTVIPYYERWMRELPTIKSLANASSERIHKLWEGLGYYTRVRNMRKAAQSIVERHGGKFPSSFDDVLALSGIGRYTAGAICSIAFNQPAPILDGNVIRVLARVFRINGNAREKETNGSLWNLAGKLVTAAAQASFSPQRGEGLRVRGDDAEALSHRPKRLGFSTSHPVARRGRNGTQSSADSLPLELSGPCSALNQSLMELGALICAPKQPRCGACPLAEFCAARRDGLIDQLPNLGERAAATARRFAACVIERDGAVLVRQRPAGVVNAHLWEFPNVEVSVDGSEALAWTKLENELGCAIQSLVPLTTVKHTITRYRITLDASRANLNGSKPAATAGKWVALNKLELLPFTSAHRKVLAALRVKQEP